MRQADRRRVAVTGMGIATSSGNTPQELFRNLLAGKSGIHLLDVPFAQALSVPIGACVSFNPIDHFTRKEANSLDRVSQLALIAAAQAWADSGMNPGPKEKKRTGVSLGTGLGGAQTIEDTIVRLFVDKADRVSPLSITKIMSNASASHISIRYGLTGPCLTYSTACSSSSVAVGEAFRLIRDGYADAMLAGGSESMMTLSSCKCWESIGVLAKEDPGDLSASCRPFAKDRSGLVLGEGAAVVVLEEMGRARKRGAPLYGELIGYGTNCDATHITSPSMEGQAQAMRLALEDAHLEAAGIGYINAHGTATVINDLIETRAIKEVFGSAAYCIPVSSTKSMHGHLMGAAGAVEFIVCLQAIGHQAIPPTAHLYHKDPQCDLDYVPCTGRTEVPLSTAMSNSFAFGGTNAVLIVKGL